MDAQAIGKIIIALGIALVLVGALFWVGGRLGLNLGSLPGDLKFSGEGWSCFVPITTSILISILLTLLLSLAWRFFGK
jgi:hypothetical protein